MWFSLALAKPITLCCRIFATLGRQPIPSSRLVRHGFTVWQARAGFEGRVAFHMMRHMACSNLYALSNVDFGAS